MATRAQIGKRLVTRNRGGLFAIGGGILLLLILVFIGWNFMTRWTPSREDYPNQGVLVDEGDGDIIWPAVYADGADFAYIRSTRGSENRDANFASNRKGAVAAGLRYGPVHHYSLCRLASDQAANFVTVVPRDARSLPPVVELSFDENCTERPGRAPVISELTTFLNQIESHFDKPALLLIDPEFEDQYLLSAAIERNIWARRDYFVPDYVTRPWVMWLANSNFRVKGIKGPVEWTVVQP